jgi:transposase
MKVLVYDGLGICLAARRLNRGCFVWTEGASTVVWPSTSSSCRHWSPACHGRRRRLITPLPWSNAAHVYCFCFDMAVALAHGRA